MNVKTLAVMCIVCLSAPAFANETDGEDAYDRRDYRTAFSNFKEAAAEGSLMAQYYLGRMYQEGRGGVRQNDTLALKWFSSAAKKGYSPAQLFLGTMYYEGNGVPRNYFQAYIWLDLAATQFVDPRKRNAIRAKRDQAALRMTSSDVAEAQRRSREMALELSGPHCDVG